MEVLLWLDGDLQRVRQCGCLFLGLIHDIGNLVGRTSCGSDGERR